ncbi:MAG TPA: condensation domain-containing protein, partial [Pseudomonadales bacterium]|nr:condensation domain-containing protein [Pseudomonadales bacterium]
MACFVNASVQPIKTIFKTKIAKSSAHWHVQARTEVGVNRMSLPIEAGLARRAQPAAYYYPLSSAQKSIWFDQALHPDLPLYNIGLLASFSGRIDCSLLEEAVERVVKAHDALRMSVEIVDGAPMLLVSDDATFLLETINFSNSTNPVKAVDEFVAREFSRPFDLSGRLWKLVLLKISNTEYVLLSKFHHLISDGIGINLFGKAVADYYNELLSG